MNRFKASLDVKLSREHCCKRIRYDVKLLQLSDSQNLIRTILENEICAYITLCLYKQ